MEQTQPNATDNTVDSAVDCAVDCGKEVNEGFRVQLTPSPTPAPIVKRVLAYATDISIIAALFYVAALILAIPTIGLLAATTSVELDGFKRYLVIALLAILALVVVLGFYHGYFIYQELKYGTTLGKRIFGLRVVSENGRALTMGQCVMRDALRYFDCAMVFPGLIAMAASDKNRRLGDMVCATLVVHSQAQEDKATFLYLRQDDYFKFVDKLGAKKVPPEDCKAYLSLAYGMFITGERPAKLEGSEKVFWHECKHRYLSSAADDQLKTLELQQFFAEHCNQQLLTFNNASK